VESKKKRKRGGEIMSKWLPKPIRGLNNLIGGIPYFEVVVRIDGVMYLSDTFFFKGQPYAVQFSGKPLFIETRSSWETHDGTGLFINDGERSLCDVGILKARHNDNLHRTFRYSLKTYEFCKRLVKRQDLEGYKKLIGV
jgi:hypothetical protein